jgi:hypothetical protein
MKEMYVAYLPQKELRCKYLCVWNINNKHTERPMIVADLSGKKQWVGHHVTNTAYKLRKATEKEVAIGLVNVI